MSENSYSSADWSIQQDFEFIFSQTADIWPTLNGARIFITGGRASSEAGYLKASVLPMNA